MAKNFDDFLKRKGLNRHQFNEMLEKIYSVKLNDIWCYEYGTEKFRVSTLPGIFSIHPNEYTREFINKFNSQNNKKIFEYRLIITYGGCVTTDELEIHNVPNPQKIIDNYFKTLIDHICNQYRDILAKEKQREPKIAGVSPKTKHNFFTVPENNTPAQGMAEQVIKDDWGSGITFHHT